jgi:glycogen debranching enzyme
MTAQDFYQNAYEALLELSTVEGINASGRDEIFGCIFGRDSFITILQILSAEEKKHNQELVDVCKRALSTLIALQGKRVNVESGEQPGKFIHEFRKDNFERLTTGPGGWYVYPDGTMKNYDTLDSTPLGLIALHKYWLTTGDNDFLQKNLANIQLALQWIMEFGDLDGDLLLEFQIPPGRKHGGLTVHSWTDSNDSFIQANGKFAKYPIAPVEVQGYAWLALRLWGNYFLNSSKGLSVKSLKNRLLGEKLLIHSEKLKHRFNNAFIFKDGKFNYPAQALDGDKNQIRTVTGNSLALLWASITNEEGESECILEEEYVNDLVHRSFEKDMFDVDCGIRTMSSLSLTFNPNSDSYHNGSFWPVLNGLCWEGLKKFRYNYEAELIRKATLKALQHFGSPIELFNKTPDGQYIPFSLPNGQTSCRVQAWSAGVELNMASENSPEVFESFAKEMVE